MLDVNTEVNSSRRATNKPDAVVAVATSATVAVMLAKFCTFVPILVECHRQKVVRCYQADISCTDIGLTIYSIMMGALAGRLESLTKPKPNIATATVVSAFISVFFVKIISYISIFQECERRGTLHCYEADTATADIALGIMSIGMGALIGNGAGWHAR